MLTLALDIEEWILLGIYDSTLKIQIYEVRTRR